MLLDELVHLPGGEGRGHLGRGGRRRRRAAGDPEAWSRSNTYVASTVTAVTTTTTAAATAAIQRRFLVDTPGGRGTSTVACGVPDTSSSAVCAAVGRAEGSIASSAVSRGVSGPDRSGGAMSPVEIL
ncbi:hypothetical protein [Lentzea indica]|uniref:hypothetical protein n=1 Tax=Lentzea indica TaxID=2604800 RepID=UPI001FE290F8|nr:hypothetical protein [Lentzea indica]